MHYHRNTSACTGTVISASGNCMTCWEPAQITARTSIPPARIEAAQDSEEILAWALEKEPLPKLIPGTYKSRMRKSEGEWRSKWRLTQQRPRDGLR